MHISRVFFKVSDILNHPLRNAVRYGKTEVVRNLRYGEGKRRRMDFYFAPDKADGKRLPVLFNVHGGGFVCGGKRYRSGIARRFAARGFFVVNVDYSLAPDERFPEGSADCIRALNALEKFSDSFPMDLDRLILTGDSAGGYYAAYAYAAAFSEQLGRKAGLPDYTGKKPVALLTFFSPFNPVKCLENPAPMGITEDIGVCLFGSAKEEDFPFPDDIVDLTLSVNGDWGPVGMVVGNKDMFCGGQEVAMIEALKNAGVPYYLYTAREKGDAHCTHLFPFMPGTPKILAFADEFLKSVIDCKSDGGSDGGGNEKE